MSNLQTPILLRATLPDAVIEKYDKEAARSGKTLEAVMSETLVRFADAHSTKPIILSDTERQTMEKAVGRNFTTGQELVTAVVRAMSINVDGVEITLSQYLLDRLQSRCVRGDFREFMKQTVKRCLEEFAGVR